MKPEHARIGLQLKNAKCIKNSNYYVKKSTALVIARIQLGFVLFEMKKKQLKNLLKRLDCDDLILENN